MCCCGSGSNGSSSGSSRLTRVLVAKMIEDQVLHYVKYLTGSIGRTGSCISSSSSSSGSRIHIVNRKHSLGKKESGTSLCEVSDW